MPKYRPRRHPDLWKPENKARMREPLRVTMFLVVVIWSSAGERKYWFGDVNQAIHFIEWLSEPNQKEDILDLRFYDDSFERLFVKEFR